MAKKAVFSGRNFVFFDDKLVINSVKKGTYKAMSKFGAYVRKTARDSLRTAVGKNQTSRPGDPPLMHVGTPKARLFFALDRNTDSVVIGSEKTKSGSVLNALEYGGYSFIERKRPKRNFNSFKLGGVGCIRVRDVNAKSSRDKFVWGRLRTQAQVDRANKLYLEHSNFQENDFLSSSKGKRVYIRARPYMRPAFRKNLNNSKLYECFHMCVNKK